MDCPHSPGVYHFSEEIFMLGYSVDEWGSAWKGYDHQALTYVCIPGKRALTLF